MRPALIVLLASLAAPALAQQISPLTGTASDTPAMQAPATAAPPAAPRPRHARRQTMRQRFEAANTTHDGKLTLDQARAAKMTRVARDFDAIDAGRKGYVTPEDIRAYGQARRAARKAAR